MQRECAPSFAMPGASAARGSRRRASGRCFSFSTKPYRATMSTNEELVIGLVSISDRASQGVYKDEGIPALEEWFARAIQAPKWRTVTRLIPDEQPEIEAALK